jgi:hypothetical protein
VKNLFHKILKALNINGRDGVVLMLALLLAFSTWLIHNLALKYNDFLKVPVAATCELKGHSDKSSNECEVVARCRATGYKVIRAALKSNKTVNVSFRASDMVHLEGDMFYITSDNLVEYANAIYGTDVNVEYFLTDTLFFRFPYENYRKVPVIPIYSLDYREQYMAEGDLKVEPDSVLVYGEPFRLETVEAVYTKPVRYYDIDKDIQGVVGLEKIRGLRLSENEVRYSLGVKRFVEVSSMLPVKAVNVPSDKVMNVYPSVVKVTLRCQFPLMDDPFSGVSIEADYEDYQKSLGGKCALKPAGLSRGIIEADMDPVAVSCVIEDR